jgi:hypothetical protein
MIESLSRQFDAELAKWRTANTELLKKLDEKDAQLAAAEARAKRYETALRRIANEDYRGNRPPSAVLAHETLEGGAE